MPPTTDMARKPVCLLSLVSAEPVTVVLTGNKMKKPQWQHLSAIDEAAQNIYDLGYYSLSPEC